MRTRIIAELGCNHQGELRLAKQMITDAARLGLWAIKLQKRDIEAIPDDTKRKPRKQENSFGPTYYEHRKALEFSTEQMIELREYAESLGLCAMVSVFDMTSAMAMVEEAGYRFIKLPSQLYTDVDLNEYLISKRKCLTLFCSTGMHSLTEVVHSAYFDMFDVTMYCRSMYPFEARCASLDTMRKLDMAMNRSILGYSSHESASDNVVYLALAAVLCGAKYFERHYTLDKTMKGSDHSTVSSNYDDMYAMIERIKTAEELLGESRDNKTELADPREIEVRKVYRGF